MTQTIDLTNKVLKIKPTLLVKEGVTYYRLDGNEYVIAVKGYLGKVEQWFEKNGSPVINTANKLPLFNFEGKMDIQILTIEEFEAIMKSSFGLQ